MVRAVDYGVGDPRFESRRSQFFPQEKSSFNFHVRTNHDAEECRGMRKEVSRGNGRAARKVKLEA